jgi:hypothetical protein
LNGSGNLGETIILAQPCAGVAIARIARRESAYQEKARQDNVQQSQSMSDAPGEAAAHDLIQKIPLLCSPLLIFNQDNLRKRGLWVLSLI